MSAQIITALRIRAARLLDEAEVISRNGEVQIDGSQFPRHQHPRSAATLALLAHEFLDLADQAEGSLTSDNRGPYCPAGQRIRRVDYSATRDPVATHEDGTICGHPGPVSFGNRP